MAAKGLDLSYHDKDIDIHILYQITGLLSHGTLT